jgi:hypothetical protein
MARSFNETSSQYLKSSSSPISSTPATLSAWVYVDSSIGIFTTATIGGVFDNSESSSNGDGLFLYISTRNPATTLRFAAQQATDGSVSTAGASTDVTGQSDKWVHVAGVFASNSSRIRYYAGGNPIENTQTRGASSADRITVGARTTTSGTQGDFFKGYICELGIWNAALTAADIAVLSLGYSPLFVRRNSLVAYLPLIGRTSPEIDTVGGYGMTLTNGPTTVAHPSIIYPSNLVGVTKTLITPTPYRRRFIIAVPG